MLIDLFIVLIMSFSLKFYYKFIGIKGSGIIGNG